MSSNVRIFPETAEAVMQFRQIMSAPFVEEPIVEMNDTTARDFEIIAKSIQACAEQWRGNQEIHFPGKPMDRKQFWGEFAADINPGVLPVLQEYYSGQIGVGKLALDLGCGNSAAVPFLLQRGWEVMAVDNSPTALEILAQKHPEAIQSEDLTLIESDITSFTPEATADLVIAADILPYTDPAKFQETWQKIHDCCVKDDGFLVGTLFRSVSDPVSIPMMNAMKEMGAWLLPDRRMVRPLLINAGYEIKTCRYRDDIPNREAMAIQFVAQKKNSNPISE